ncbi:MAG: response regulator [Pontiella sp.]
MKTVQNKEVRILLVEDNLVNQKVASIILRKAGCIVDIANNGQDAVDQIQQERYDLVLMDCQMPIMDGFEATTKIRAMSEPICNIPIIAITAQAMADDKQRCLDGGMNDYIPKPVNQHTLIRLINQYVGQL